MGADKMKDNAFYFSHDTNARNDERILQLLTEYDWQGYGIYWAIVEMLNEASNYRLSLSGIKGLAWSLSVESDFLEVFLKRCFELRLFQKDDDNNFYSKRVLKNVDKREKKSILGKKAAEKRWSVDKSGKNADALGTQCQPNAIKERKGKEIKKRKDKRSSKSFEQFWKKYPRKVGKVKSLEAWNKINPDGVLIKTIMVSVEKHRKSKGWQDPQYIPHPSTWLNQQRWDDEILEKKEVVDQFKTDTAGFYIGYCSTCGEGSSYSRAEIWGDSRCCKDKIVPLKMEVVP
jgi:hypothetical protein|tara:strand:+ start:1771 stop:2634 length:864 start_codon:yes stop_codon:yes gene_type:complete